MRLRKTFQWFLASALILGVTQISSPVQSSFFQQAAIAEPGSSVNWTQGAIKVTGAGAPPESGSPAQKRLMAKRAAIADGYRQLAEQINGVKVDAETVVQNYVVANDTVKTQVSALIKGARMSPPRYLSDGSIEVDMTLNLYGQNSLSSVMQPTVLKEKKANTQPVEPMPTPNTSTYSSLIVDCLGTGVEPAMSPTIKNADGQEIYIGDRPIDPDMVVNIGIVGYTKSIKEAKLNSRAGANPLVVKAIKSGGKLMTDAIIRSEDAQKVLEADNSGHFLSHSKVIFVID